MKNLILILVAMVLTACAGGSGGDKGGGGGGGTPATPTVKVTPENYHFGLSQNAGSAKTQVLTITNNSSVTTTALSLNILTTPLSVTSDSCTGQTLSANQTCAITVRFNPTSSFNVNQTLQIKQGSTVLGSTKIGAFSSPYATSANRIANELLATQATDGSWADGVGFDMGTTLLAVKSLLDSKSEINYTRDVLTGTHNLNITLNYLSQTTAGGSLRNIDFVTDRNTVMPEWNSQRPSGFILREILPFYPVYHNQLSVAATSSPSSSYASKNDYLHSRQFDVSTQSMYAQYAYMFDKNMMQAHYGLTNDEAKELALKDLYLLMQALVKENKTTELQQLSQIFYYNYARTASEIENEFGVHLQYSSQEFNHNVFSDPLIDYTISDVLTCRGMSYQLAVFGLVLQHGNLNPLDNDGVVSTGINILYDTLKNTWLNDVNQIGRTQCLPAMNMAFSQVPSKYLAHADVNLALTDLLSNISAGNYDFANGGGPLLMSETLEALHQHIR